MDEAEEPSAQAPSSDPGEFTEHLRKQAEITENPVYVWDALHTTLNAAAAQGPLDEQLAVAIPGWVADYLLAASARLQFLFHGINFGPSASEKRAGKEPEKPETIIDLALHPEVVQLLDVRRISMQRAMELVPSALGLQSSGKNAFKNRARDFSRLTAGLAYEVARSQGLTADNARASVRQQLRLTISEESLEKEIRLGRQLAARQRGKPQG